MNTPKLRLAVAVFLGLLGALFSLGLMSDVPHLANAAPLVRPAAGVVPVTSTIQNAINAAQNGDTVVIPGQAYTESLTVNKDITLTGASSVTTIIHAVTGQRVITVTSGHTLRLNDLTVTGGRAGAGGGGGVCVVDNGSLSIVNCIIADNWASYGGGVFQGSAGRVDVVGSRIERNHSDNHGGGLYVNGDAALTNTLVLTNTATWDGGGLTVWTGRIDMLGGILAGNQAGRNGGGINQNNGVSVSGTQFISNTAGQDGGGLLQYNSGQQVNVTNARFERDWSSRDGGGLWAQGNVTVTNSLFISNTADSRSSTDTRGGGVYASSGALLVISSTFRANQVQCSGCSFTYGGGVHVDTVRPVTVQGSLFEANGGWFGGGLHSAQAITIRGTTFQDNSAGYGGGAYVVGADIQNSGFLRNHAVNKGGGLEADGETSLAGARFIGNTAGFGGGLYLPVAADARLVNAVIADNRASYNGSGLLAEAASLRSSHTTIARNVGGDRSGVCLATNPMGQYGSVAVMTNTILVSQTLGITATAGSTATLNGVLWYSNTVNTSGAGAIAVANAVIGAPAFAADGYHLTAASMAIDQGVNSGVTTDIDGDPRPWGAGYDLGADEFRTCWARLNDDTTDYGLVQAAVDASTQATDTVKVAGYCAGVQMHAGETQTVYVSKTVTIRGGYTTTNWTTSDPTANATTLDALGRGGVVYLTGGSGVSVTLENLIIRGGFSSYGGGILNNFSVLNVSNATVSGNSAGLGGGIRNEQGALTVANSTFANNTGSSWGGGIANYYGTLSVSSSTFTSNTSPYGGGIADNGYLTVTGSTFAGNSAQEGGGVFVYQGSATLSGGQIVSNTATDGGGTYNYTGTLALVNSTVSGNKATGSGGGLYSNGGTSVLTYTTVASNTAAGGGGGIHIAGGTVVLQDTIVAYNGTNCNAALTSNGHNLEYGHTCGLGASGDMTDTNPLLGPLQDNGGSTWTHALLPGSPAIDRIPSGVNGCGTTITTDQRGQPRPGTFTHLCDIGAYEAQGVHYEIYLPLVVKQ